MVRILFDVNDIFNEHGSRKRVCMSVICREKTYIYVFIRQLVEHLSFEFQYDHVLWFSDVPMNVQHLLQRQLLHDKH